MNIRTTFLVY